MNMSEDVNAVSMQVSEKAAEAALSAFKSVLDSVGRLFRELLYALDCFIKAEPDNIWAEYAAYLKNKVIQYGRTFTSHDEDTAAIYFYEDEAATMIKLLSFFIFITAKPSDDYYALIEKKKWSVAEASEAETE